MPPATNNPTFASSPIQVMSYAGVPLQIVRTLEYECTPENSFDGADYLGIFRVIIGVTAYVNPAATASLSGQNPPGFAGDRAGVTLRNLQQVLMQKRQTLKWSLGPDAVITSPQDPTFACDAKLGPNPLALRVLEVYGAKTCLIYFRIETYVGGNAIDPKQNSIVLSNRWTAQASVDDDWRTTLRFSGRMRLRTDMLNQGAGIAGLGTLAGNVFSPDAFRAAVLPPAQAGFKRGSVNVQVVPDGTELEWDCIDEQVFLNLGANPGCTRVEGNVTAGADVGYKDFKDMVKIGGSVVQSVMGGDIMTALWNIFQSFFPAVRKTFQLRVYGAPQADRVGLFQIGLAIIADRFGLATPPGLGGVISGGLVSLYLTTPINKGCIELRGAVLGTLSNLGNSFDPANFDKIMKIGDFTNSNNPLGWSYSTPGANPNPPNDNGAKGVFIGTMLEQALMGNFQLPPNNQPAVGAFDLPNQQFT
ncbi:MAG TPA: hypothetical protein VMS17_13325 [Gemmataceae bacterium]|nr:hypothetical protein [Gemmataceae bacterium]